MKSTVCCGLPLFFILLTGAVNAADDWTQKSPAPKPSARFLHKMAYIGGDQVLLFGGDTDESDFIINNETWVYDLSDNTWTQDANTILPSARVEHALSETSMDGSSFLVLFAGFDSNRLDDTWTFGGGDYSLPVELSVFTGTITQNGVLLQWRTQSETNNLGFRVYRSANKDGKFEKVAFIDGYGSTPIPHDYTFTDKKVKSGETYYYFLEDIDIAGNTERSEIITVTFPRTLSKAVPTQFVLHQNYPNPFNPETWIPYELAADTEVTITIYNSFGYHIRTLELGTQPANSYLVKEKAAYWDGRSHTGERVSSGIYYYHFQTGEFTDTKKMIILK